MPLKYNLVPRAFSLAWVPPPSQGKGPGNEVALKEHQHGNRLRIEREQRRETFSPLIRGTIANILLVRDYKTKVAKLGTIYGILSSEAEEAIRRKSLNFIFANVTGNLFKDSIGYALPSPCQQTTPSLQPSLNVK